MKIRTKLKAGVARNGCNPPPSPPPTQPSIPSLPRQLPTQV